MGSQKSMSFIRKDQLKNFVFNKNGGNQASKSSFVGSDFNQKKKVKKRNSSL
jgi:hypothetical protein